MAIHPSVPPTRRPRGPALIAVIALLLATLVVPAGAVGCDLQQGDGTELDPYEVANADDLGKVGVGGCGLDAHYRQTEHIDLTGTTHTPISGAFTGSYDGREKELRGLTVNATGGGMFVEIGSSGSVFDLTLIDVAIQASSHPVGALAGMNDGGTITGVVVASGTVVGVDQVGGLVGRNFGDILDSESRASVDGREVLGGLVGEHGGSGSIVRSVARGHVTGTGTGKQATAQIGGLVGENLATIEDSSAHGDVVVTGTPEIARNLGGLVGLSTGSITGSQAYGSVISTAAPFTEFAGGLVGEVDGGSLTGVEAHGDVTIDVTAATFTDGLFIGGLVGRISDANIEDAVAHGSVSVRATVDGYAARVGGLAGVSLRADLSDVRAFGAVDVTAPSTVEYIGGLVGRVAGGTITLARAEGQVTATSLDPANPSRYVGGLIGEASAVTGPDLASVITQSIASGDVTGGTRVGGLIGDADPAIVRDSAASGDVNGVQYLGGLVGYAGGTTVVERSASSGDVAGGEDVGGLVGEVRAHAVVQDSYATGAAEGTANVGGLVGTSLGRVERTYAVGSATAPAEARAGGLIGWNLSDAVATASFWSTSANPGLQGTNGLGEASGVVGLDDAGLRDRAVYLTADWAIVDGWASSDPPDAVWGICSLVNEGYPFLLWQFDSDPCTVPDPAPPSPPAPAPLPDPSPVRGPGGELPGEGEGAGTIDGEPVVVEVVPTPDGGVGLTGDGFGVVVTPEPGGSGVGPDPGVPGGDGDASLLLVWGRGALVDLFGFAPGTQVRVWLLSEPQLLGVFTTDAQGALAAATEQLPDSVSACPHTLHLQGRLPGGRLLELSVGAWVEAGRVVFTDTVTSPSRRSVACLADLEVARGYADGTYQPNRVVTRQAVAAFLHRLAGEPEPSGGLGVLDRYGDVGPEHPFAVPIAWVTEQGLAQGYADGMFGPSRPVTRQALAAFLHRAAGAPVPAVAGGGFVDVPVDHPFGEAIGWLAQVGITRGYADGTFRPAEPLRRAPTASLLVRATAREQGFPR